MLLISLLIVLIVGGFIVWAVGLLPLDATIQKLIKGIVILLLVLYAILVVVKIAGFDVPIRF
jgi:hypothetical protein